VSWDQNVAASLSEQVGPLTPNTRAEQVAAVITVCSHATDADDARALLGMLGLVA
jgi:hypothetical protein